MTNDLEEVSGIGKATAERLRTSGIVTVEKLASTTLEELTKLKIKGVGESTALKYIKNAQKLIKEKSSDTKPKLKKEDSLPKPEKHQKHEPTKKQKPVKGSNLKELIKNTSDDQMSPEEKANSLELLNSITESAGQKSPSKPSLKALGAALWSIIEKVEPITKAVKPIWGVISSLWS